MATDSTEFEKSIRIPFQKDGFDDVRAEYSQMLRQQLAKGNNGLTKTKFITFGVEGESMAQVKPRLDHIQNDLLNNFHRLGVQAKPLNGVQRLKLMHDMFNILAKQLNISPHQLSYVTHSGEGEGLLFFGNVILPFVDHFPKDLELYRILTTKLNEISEGAQK